MSKSKKYDIIVYIGRFQPFHNGHLTTMKTALEQADEVVVLLGSANRSSDIRNPWGTQERTRMIQEVMRAERIPFERVSIFPINDSPYNNDLWLTEVQSTVNAYAKSKNDEPKIAIIGFKRDHTSFYLDLFPQWDKIEIEEIGTINSTAIRNSLFATEGYFDFRNLNEDIKNDLPRATIEWINDFFITEKSHADRLRAEYEHIKRYKGAWENSPYVPTFITCDAVVTQAGHILLVRRGALPGEGLWALPGGFVNHNERVFDAAVRELYEETKIKVPEKVIRRSCVAKDYFDDPDRSLRGRTITFGFHFALDAVPDGLPKVKGSDDAKKAKWFTFDEFKKMDKRLFEDHSFIAKTLIGNM